MIGFLIDVNGNDKPNIMGRDFFGFYITPQGSIIDEGVKEGSNVSVNTKINNCKSANSMPAQWCFGALRDNNWKMDY